MNKIRLIIITLGVLVISIIGLAGYNKARIKQEIQCLKKQLIELRHRNDSLESAIRNRYIDVFVND